MLRTGWGGGSSRCEELGSALRSEPVFPSVRTLAVSGGWAGALSGACFCAVPALPRRCAPWKSVGSVRCAPGPGPPSRAAGYGAGGVSFARKFWSIRFIARGVERWRWRAKGWVVGRLDLLMSQFLDGFGLFVQAFIVGPGVGPDALLEVARAVLCAVPGRRGTQARRPCPFPGRDFLAPVTTGARAFRPGHRGVAALRAGVAAGCWAMPRPRGALEVTGRVSVEEQRLVGARHGCREPAGRVLGAVPEPAPGGAVA